MKILTNISSNVWFLATIIFYCVLPSLSKGQDKKLVINEIMINPNGTALPPYEYIELHNPSKENINIKNFKIKINERTLSLPDRVVSKGQFLILTQGNQADLFSKYGNTIGIDSWPPLHNQQATLSLLDDHDHVLESFTYSHTWHESSSKRNGGWSLERINPNIPCHFQGNWSSSQASAGGTPGKRNSIYQSGKWPVIVPEVTDIQSHSIRLKIPAGAKPDISSLEITPKTIRIENTRNEDDNTILHIQTADEILNNTAYTLHLHLILCDSHIQKTEIPLFVPTIPEFNNLVISEILPRPKPNGVKFVEIFNTSPHTFDLSQWSLGDRLISRSPHFIYPYEYRVLTTDLHKLQSHYPKTAMENGIEMSSLPPFYSERGEVLLRYGENVIDSLTYTDAWHQPFLKNTQGISLERQDLWADTHSPDNFSSASTHAGGATPGYENSKRQPTEDEEEGFILKTKVFSPENASEEKLTFFYRLNLSNPMCDFYIYNDKGILVKRLLKNKSIGNQGEIAWDGKDDYNNLSPSGIYVYAAEIYTATGEFKRYKDSFVIHRQKFK